MGYHQRELSEIILLLVFKANEKCLVLARSPNNLRCRLWYQARENSCVQAAIGFVSFSDWSSKWCILKTDLRRTFFKPIREHSKAKPK